ncbi:MAG: hypothetical protein JW995_11135 [Melioribacteraceae bacterium]|nr:hypothetical protein [Melioribacteraceae bacterium]
MELIPVIIKILIVSSGLFLVVLVLSFLTSKISRYKKENDYTEIVKQRKSAYSREQREYLAKYRSFSENGELRIHEPHNSFDLQRPIVKEIHVRRKGDGNFRYYDTGEFMKTMNRSGVYKKQRYSVLNDTISADQRNMPNRELRIFYPIDFQRSA